MLARWGDFRAFSSLSREPRALLVYCSLIEIIGKLLVSFTKIGMIQKKHEYKRNFLTNVIFRIDFPLILSLEGNPPKDFQNKITEKFPILEPIEEFKINIGNIAGNVQESTKSTIWRFTNKERSTFVQLSFQHLVIERKSNYSSFEEFKITISEVLTAFLSEYPNPVTTRLGLRYINEISLKEKNVFDWDKYINKSLIGTLQFVENKDQIIRSLSSVELVIDDDTYLNIRSGVFNSSYPAKVINKEYMLRPLEIYEHRRFRSFMAEL